MLKYLLKRVAQLVVISFVISVLVFLLVHLLPGDPTTIILGVNATAANRQNLLHQLGLNLPLYHQYWIWIGNVFHGNLGQSYLTHETVGHIITTGFPIDLELIIISQVVAFAVAIPLALVTARRPNRPLDNVATTGTFGLLALPPFLLAPIFVAVFAVGLHWFPATGYVPFTQNPATNLHDMVLPGLALTAGSIAVYFRLLRSDLPQRRSTGPGGRCRPRSRSTQTASHSSTSSLAPPASPLTPWPWRPCRRASPQPLTPREP